MIKICCIRFSKNNKIFFKGGFFLAVGMRGQSIMARKAWDGVVGRLLTPSAQTRNSNSQMLVLSWPSPFPAILVLPTPPFFPPQ